MQEAEQGVWPQDAKEGRSDTKQLQTLSSDQL